MAEVMKDTSPRYRVFVSLDQWFSDERCRCVVSVLGSRRVRWLARRLRALMRLRGNFHLLTDGHLLPPDEYLEHVLRPDDYVQVIPAEKDWFADEKVAIHSKKASNSRTEDNSTDNSPPITIQQQVNNMNERDALQVESCSASIPITSYSASIPITSCSASIPITSCSSSIPITSCSASIPITSCSASISITSCSASIPITSCSASIPITSCSASIPITSCSASIPITNCSSSIPITSCSASIPITSNSTNKGDNLIKEQPVHKKLKRKLKETSENNSKEKEEVEYLYLSSSVVSYLDTDEIDGMHADNVNPVCKNQKTPEADSLNDTKNKALKALDMLCNQSGISGSNDICPKRKRRHRVRRRRPQESAVLPPLTLTSPPIKMSKLTLSPANSPMLHTPASPDMPLFTSYKELAAPIPTVDSAPAYPKSQPYNTITSPIVAPLYNSSYYNPNTSISSQSQSAVTSMKSLQLSLSSEPAVVRNNTKRSLPRVIHSVLRET